MLDAALDMSSVLAFLPLPLVSSNHFNSLNNWSPRGVQDPLLDTVIIIVRSNKPNNGHCFVLAFQELKECAGRVFIDSSPEFAIPDVITLI